MMKGNTIQYSICLLFLAATLTCAWIQQPTPTRRVRSIQALTTIIQPTSTTRSSPLLFQSSSPEETTKKFGLEAGIVESLKQNDNGESAKSLLKRYGIAYLATSIPLAIISFVICYLLVDNGIDVAGLLQKVGIENNNASEKASTFALAYAAHKAASPIRFPPTVLLTPIVAKFIGKEPATDENDQIENTQ